MMIVILHEEWGFANSSNLGDDISVKKGELIEAQQVTSIDFPDVRLVDLQPERTKNNFEKLINDFLSIAS
jgi:hypothetical protein